CCRDTLPWLISFSLARLARPMDSGSQLARRMSYERCRTSFDWVRGAACFARRNWLQSAQTSVVRVERRADTARQSREHHCARARCILRSAVGHAAQAWRVTAERAAQ